MLSLILGRAGTGKTMFILDDIKQKMAAGESNMLLIVPEQYSHDAEKQLCAVCGDRISLHGETLSFTRLCAHVFSETGGAPENMLDAGGQTLIMYRAAESVEGSLKAFKPKGLRTEMLLDMLDGVKEFKSQRLSPSDLGRIAEQATDPLRDKLSDLALINDSFDALIRAHGGDASDRMALLADKIGQSAVASGCVYFDGFNDFTAQEFCVIEALLREKTEITICLTCDMDDDSEVFILPRKTVEQIRRLAGKCDVKVTTTRLTTRDARRIRLWPVKKSPALIFLEKHLFAHKTTKFAGRSGAIALYAAPSRHAECEYAAQKVLEFARAGYRWRDIGVMARDWDVYGSICESVFEKNGIPFFSSGRADILDKAPVALIDAALGVAVSGWEYKTVFKYLKTGLANISVDACAEIENYVIKWNIRGSMWNRDWILPTRGYGTQGDDEASARLNDMRLRLTKPIIRLREGIKGASKAGIKLGALYGFLEDINLPERIAEKAEELEKRGEARLAREYGQIWDIIINAMEQMYALVGEDLLDAAEFRKLFMLSLSRYDVGVIPTSLDRTALGGMEMSRRRELKCLIILGATDENMPMLAKGGGVLSDNEREELRSLDADIQGGLDERLSREMNMLYSTLTLPSDELVIIYPSGGGERPSFFVKRIMEIFDISETTMKLTLRSPGQEALTTYDARLSGTAAGQLYGDNLTLSASRVDIYYSCPFRFFAQNGLKLTPLIPAELDAPTAGIFTHYILEGVAREIKETVGFRNADEALCRDLATSCAKRFVSDYLYGFEGKNARFIYLFNRLEEAARRITFDMLEELGSSDFEPTDFELDFSELAGKAGEERTRFRLILKGIIDRVDVYRRNGKVYLRVVDYKTGIKSFSLPDILHGKDMQMLIYLFALQKYGKERYGGDVLPAGALYFPARDVIVRASRNATIEDLGKMREKELRRAGLVLNDPDIIEAMETGKEKKYIPVKYAKDGAATGEGLASAEQVALLSEHVDLMLGRAAEEILGGNIECRPYYKSAEDNACVYCEYSSICAFDMDMRDKRRFIPKMKTSEVWETLQISRAGTN